MEYLHINKENIDKEHICCAMSNKQSLLKKAWMTKLFDDGLVFIRSSERGKCFIEYLPIENAWVPLTGNNYYFINCLWVAGALKGHGYSNDLLEFCLNDAKKNHQNGVCILSSKKRKKEFLSDPQYLEHKGFKVADESVNDITLMYLSFNEQSELPKFKKCAKNPTIKEKGWVIFYSDQCPFTSYWVNRVCEVAKEKNIEIKTIHLENKEQAQNLNAPITNYALFKDGKYLTHNILTDKKFLDLVNKGDTNE